MADPNTEAEFTVEALLKLTNALKKTKEHTEVALEIEKKAGEFSKEQLEAHIKAAKILLGDGDRLHKLRKAEIETLEDAAKQLAIDLKQGSLYSQMMGKRYNDEGKLLGKTQFLHRDFTGMSETLTGLTKEGGGFKGLVAAIGVGIIGLSFLADEMDKSLAVYQDLRAQGQSFSGSMLEMRIAASSSAMSLEEFASFTKDTSNAVRQFGVVRLGEMSKNARIAMRSVGQFGMTTEQTNKALTNYMEMEAVRGNFRNMDDKKRTANFVNFVKSTDRMSKATGATRDALMSLTKTLSEDKTIVSMLRGKSEEAGDAMLDVLRGISAIDKDVGEMVTGMVKNLGIYGSSVMDEGSALFANMAPGMQDMIKRIENGSLKGAEAFEAMANMGASLDVDSVLLWSAQGVKGADALLALTNAVDRNRIAAEDARKADLEAAKLKPMTEFMANFQDSGKTFMAIFEKIGILLIQVLGPAIDLLGWTLTKLMWPIGQLSEGLTLLVDWYQDLGESIKGIITGFALLATGMFLFRKRILGDSITGLVKRKVPGTSAVFGAVGKAATFVKGKTVAAGSRILDKIPGGKLVKGLAKKLGLTGITEETGEGTGTDTNITNSFLIVKLHQESIDALKGGGGLLGGEGGGLPGGKGDKGGKGSKGGGKGMNFIKGIRPTQMLAAGAAMIMVAGAVWIFTKALENFENISWESIGKGIVSMGALAVAAIFIGKAKGPIMQGAIAMGLLGLAMIPFAFAMNLMQDVDWGTILKMTVAIGAMSAMAALLSFASPFIITGSIAIGILGLALLPFAVALKIAQDPIIAFTDSFKKLADIDGASLFGTAAGIVAVGSALAFFGAAAAGGGVLSAIGNLFGGDPAEKMKAFADMGPALEKAGRGMKALSAANPEHIKALADAVAIFGEKVGEYSASIGTVEQTQNIVNALESSVRLQAETINTEAPVKKQDMTLAEHNTKLITALTEQTDAIIGTNSGVKKSVDEVSRKLVSSRGYSGK